MHSETVKFVKNPFVLKSLGAETFILTASSIKPKYYIFQT